MGGPSSPGPAPSQFWPPHLLGPHSRLLVSLLGVTQVLWIVTDVRLVVSAGHWHVWLMSARPQRNAPDWRHCTDSTFGSPWKQGRAQLPLPLHLLVVLSRQTHFLALFFLLSVFPVCSWIFCSSTCLRDLCCPIGNWVFWRISYSWTVKVFIVVLIVLMKNTGTHVYVYLNTVWAFKSPLFSSYMSPVWSLSSSDFLSEQNFSLLFSLYSHRHAVEEWPAIKEGRVGHFGLFVYSGLTAFWGQMTRLQCLYFCSVNHSVFIQISFTLSWWTGRTPVGDRNWRVERSNPKQTALSLWVHKISHPCSIYKYTVVRCVLFVSTFTSDNKK